MNFLTKKRTFAPASANPLATSYPIPPEPPVMITVFPSRRKDLKILSLTGGLGALIDFCVPLVPFVAIFRICLRENYVYGRDFG